MTKALGLQDTTELHQKFNDARDWVQLEGSDNWLVGGVFGGISDALNAVVLFFQELIAIPAFPRPVPEIGWLGVIALAVWFTYAFAGLRSTILVTATFLFFGVVDLWSDSMDTLIITLLAVVICMVVGIPLGIWMARRKAVSNSVTPVLDIMQTFPPFCYLAPLALFFGIGSACALVLTVIYALPPIVRITEHGIRSVSPTTQEAARSLGLTGRPDAPVGAAADGPTDHRRRHQPVHDGRAVDGHHRGPGQRTRAGQARGRGPPDAERGRGLRRRPGHRLHGDHARPHHDRRQRARHRPDHRRLGERHGRDADDRRARAAAAVGHRGRRPRPARCPASRRRAAGCCWRRCSSRSLVCVYLSRQQLSLAVFPDVSETPVLKWISGPELARLINEFTDWFVGNVDTFTIWIKDQVTIYLINPLQDLLSQSPWWLMAIVLLAVAYVLGGWRPAAITVVCEAVILWTGLWNDTMITLSMTLIATALVMVIAVVLGVAMGRSRRADVSIRPFLDAFQVIPPFVYLVPALALFAPGRFTAIMAATAYAVPIATKLVADGIRGVAPTTVEAARSTGSTRWQMISKVQLPMARESLVLATNQGLLYVLSMVVIGGMVGGGSLGYIVVSGFSQDQLFGKGLCAGIAIAALGVMLDRIARYAAARYGR